MPIAEIARRRYGFPIITIKFGAVIAGGLREMKWDSMLRLGSVWKLLRRGSKAARGAGVGVFLTAALVVLGTAATGTGSIFDDDWTPSKPLAHPPVVAPGSATAPTGNPAQAAPGPAAVAPAVGVAGRAPMPGAAEKAKSRSLFKEAFASQLLDRSMTGRRKLADALLAESKKPDYTAADRFVLLGGSIEAAKESGILRDCFKSAETMARDFPVDEMALKLDAALKMNIRADTLPIATENLEAGIELLDALTVGEDFADAARLSTALRPVAIKAGPDLQDALWKRASIVDTLHAGQDRVAIQMATLEKSPNDPAANLEVGSYYCFNLGNWEKGLPFLARAADPKMKSLATLELSKPRKTEELMQLADGWWESAGGKTGLGRARALQHAIAEYRAVLPELKGLQHAVAEKRLEEAEQDVVRLLPPSEQAPVAKTATMDPRIAEAVQRAVAYLLSQQNPWGHWDVQVPPPKKAFNQAYGGATGLAVYALLIAGEDPRKNTALEGGMDALSKFDLEGVYVLSFRIQALSHAPNPILYHKIIVQDVERLTTGLNRDHSLFTYRAPRLDPNPWDLSNTQYGWLGLAVGNGKSKSLSWKPIIDFLVRRQLADGAFMYDGGNAPSLSMTAGGATMLLLGRERLPAGRLKQQADRSLDAALKWLDSHHFVTGNWTNYYLLEIQRVGQLSGRKTFNNLDWYATGVDNILARQAANGSWNNVVDTAMAVIFLCEGGVR